MKKYVCAIGGINIDIKGVSSGLSADSHPGKIFITEGGVARNISENLSRLGIDVFLFGCIGKDGFGKRILDSADKSGMHTENLIVSDKVNTAMYLSVSGSNGKLNYAVNDMKDSVNLIDVSYIKKHIDFITKSSLVVTDANVNINVLNFIIDEANKKGIPVFLDAVSSDKGSNVNEIKGFIDYLSVNTSEFKSIFGFAPGAASKEKISVKHFGKIIVRKGKNGSELYDADNGKKLKCKPIPADVTEPNGAGDAFNAGFIYSVLNNNSIGDSLEFGTCASYFALKSELTVSVDITKKKLDKLFRESKNIIEQ